MVNLAASVIFEGVLFSSARDRIVRNGLNEMKRRAAKEGAKLVRAHLNSGHGVRSGDFKSSIHGELRKNRYGLISTDHKPVIGTWLETGKRRGVRTRFRGYAMFRRGRRELQKDIDRIVAPELRALVKELDG